MQDANDLSIGIDFRIDGISNIDTIFFYSYIKDGNLYRKVRLRMDENINVTDYGVRTRESISVSVDDFKIYDKDFKIHYDDKNIMGKF